MVSAYVAQATSIGEFTTEEEGAAHPAERGQPARQLPESRDDPLDVHGSYLLGLRFRVAIKPARFRLAAPAARAVRRGGLPGGERGLHARLRM